MMRFALVINNIQRLAKGAVISAAFFLWAIMPAKAAIDIATLGNQSVMAEQGAICASFSALMENQSLINSDLGALWSERRKFSGAVIRRAVELSNLPAPSEGDIDLLINEYREWLILNLSAQEAGLSSNDYQSDVQDLIRTNCKSLYLQADKAIIKRYPKLAYLINKQAQSAGADPKADEALGKQIDTLIKKNNELNLKIIALRAEISTLKQARKIQAPAKPAPTKLSGAKPAEEVKTPTAAPTPRPALQPKKPEAQPEQTTAQTASTGRFFAQLGSFANADSAKNAKASLTKTYPALFGELSLEIKPHLFASGKTLYRVQTSRADRPSITKICDKLWDARMGCLIKTKID